MIQGCFSNPASPPAKISTTVGIDCTSNESLITCIYLTRLLDSPIHLTLTWSRTPSSHTLTIHAPDCFSLTLSLLPSTFSLFRSRSGSKPIRFGDHKVRVHYDFTRAELGRPNSAEPGSGFYLVLVCDGRVEFRLGDMVGELDRRLGVSRLGDSGESRLMSRREHVFGRRRYVTRAEFLGSGRMVEIECSGGAMKVKFDGETKLHVKKLAWKFRGNEKMFINGVMVDFYWDVFNWVDNNNNGGNGVFVFQVGDGGVCPEVVGPEKKLMRKNSPSMAVIAAAAVALSPAGSSSSVWQWAEESSDCGRSSSGSSSTTARSSGSFSGGSCGGGGGGFSLVLYAWRRE
ncbi:hypothetical protein RND81_09G218900 [Saponaria officinalis]|uniref:DUF868 family protein n=1 Tax=Saponaria officinalis TaxID=3572 RepID=A0AAW1IQP7_SAPOF